MGRTPSRESEGRDLGGSHVLHVQGDLLSCPALSGHEGLPLLGLCSCAANVWRLALAQRAAGGWSFSDRETFYSFVIYAVFKYAILFTVALITPLIYFI